MQVNLELQLGTTLEYLAVENGVERVEDLWRQAKLELRVCNKLSSQPIHRHAGGAMKLMRQREKDCTPNETTTNLGSVHVAYRFALNHFT